MPNLQDLIAASQGGGAPAPQAPQGAADPAAALQALIGRVAPPTAGSGGANPMLQAMTQLIGGQGAANVGPSPVIDRAPFDGPPSPQDLDTLDKYPTDGNIANFDARYGKGNAEYAANPKANRSTRSIDDPPFPGQAVMGNYLGLEKGYDNHMPYGPLDDGAPQEDGRSLTRGMRNQSSGEPGDRPMTTEQELDDVSKRMGGGDPSADGNFPTAKEIKALNSGELTPKEFDAKWGRGAAKEMMDATASNGDTDDDGDHEYR